MSWILNNASQRADVEKWQITNSHKNTPGINRDEEENSEEI